MLLTGPKALEFHYGESPITGKNQVLVKKRDFFLSKDCFQDRSQFQAKIISETHPLRHVLAYKNLPRVPVDEIGEVFIPSPELLYIIYRSQIHSNKDWARNLACILFLRDRISPAGFSNIERLTFEKTYDDFQRLEAPYGSMQAPNEDFFKRFKHSFIRLYPHDDLHYATCYYREPLFRRLKPDINLAYLSPQSFLRMPHKDKVRLVREEAFVFALERVIIPSIELNMHYSNDHAYQYAIHKICTDATRGWFRSFAVDHYSETIKRDIDFESKFLAAIAAGRLQKIPSDHTSVEFYERLERYMLKVQENMHCTLGLQ